MCVCAWVRICVCVCVWMYVDAHRRDHGEITGDDRSSSRFSATLFNVDRNIVVDEALVSDFRRYDEATCAWFRVAARTRRQRNVLRNG